MKERIDSILVNLGYARSREIAKNMIKAGEVVVNGKVVEKGSLSFEEEGIIIVVRSNKPKYVSRGGFKLEKAMTEFPISLTGLTCMDVGASTGGFTDCMLQNGAAKVYAVDVGHDQLAPELATRPEVVNMEGCNFRYMTREDFPEQMDFLSVDVSFISLTYILPVAYQVLKEEARMVCLIKPQFEAGKGKVNKKGVVKERAVHKEVLLKIVTFSTSLGFSVEGLTYSPIKGPEGNIEYLLFLEKKSEVENMVDADRIVSVIQLSHMELE